PPPLAQAAPLAPLFLQSLSEQPELDVVAASSPPPAEDVLDWLAPGARHDRTSSDCVPPSVTAEPELCHALRHRVTGFVMGTDCLPVVSLGEIHRGRHAEYAEV